MKDISVVKSFKVKDKVLSGIIYNSFDEVYSTIPFEDQKNAIKYLYGITGFGDNDIPMNYYHWMQDKFIDGEYLLTPGLNVEIKYFSTLRTDGESDFKEVTRSFYDYHYNAYPHLFKTSLKIVGEYEEEPLTAKLRNKLSPLYTLITMLQDGVENKELISKATKTAYENLEPIRELLKEIEGEIDYLNGKD